MAHLLLAAALALFAATAEAAVGLTEIAGKKGEGIVTVYYPSSSDAQTVKHGPFNDFQVAWHGTPRRGNGRLIVISHGSGGAPWVHADLARALVDDGFVVARLRSERLTVTSPNTGAARPGRSRGSPG